jgi:predicted negative regulator of RcsB-dependent stress response
MKKWWKRNRSTFAFIGGVILILGILFLLGWFDYHIWRLQHPQAPWWTYLFRGKY